MFGKTKECKRDEGRSRIDRSTAPRVRVERRARYALQGLNWDEEGDEKRDDGKEKAVAPTASKTGRTTGPSIYSRIIRAECMTARPCEACHEVGGLRLNERMDESRSVLAFHRVRTIYAGLFGAAGSNIWITSTRPPYGGPEPAVMH
jgi:hypothetical protein